MRGQVHTNGIESFWSTLKRAHKGTFHRLSPKHLHRYVDEFVGRHNMRELDTLDQMAAIARRMENAQLRYRDLVVQLTNVETIFTTSNVTGKRALLFNTAPIRSAFTTPSLSIILSVLTL